MRLIVRAGATLRPLGVVSQVEVGSPLLGHDRMVPRQMLARAATAPSAGLSRSCLVCEQLLRELEVKALHAEAAVVRRPCLTWRDGPRVGDRARGDDLPGGEPL